MHGRIRLDMVCGFAPSEVVERLERGLESAEGCSGSVRKNHAMLFLPEAERHFWSPWLDLRITEHARGSHLTGTFGPHPEVWTGFVFLWAALVAAWGFGLIFGSGQWMIGEEPFGLYATAGASFGLVGSCGINITGQRATVHQRAVLYRFLLDVIGDGPVFDDQTNC